jgi:transcriptional regulator with XRE-family HTH domain
MSVREAYAATMQWLRMRQGLSQRDLYGQAADQAHISRLEAGKVSPTIDLTADLARALGLKPLSFVSMVAAADESKTARVVLAETLAELEQLGLADTAFPGKPQKLEAPQSVAAAQKRKAIQELKEAGLTQAEASRQLGIHEATVRRHWH